MKLSNIVSKDLLPDFAESISWVMNALDGIIQVIKARSVSIDAPLTMDSIEALTDEELQALYAQYGLALYYPDISRARRNWMLYNMARIWHYLGTPKAVEFLCQYIFSDIDIELKVHDNGAFDTEGRLVNPDMVDVFDIEIIPGVTILPPEANQRILENVIRFSRNSQALRQIYYSYDTFVSQTVSPALPYNGIVAVENVLNEAVCEDSPTPPGPTLPTVTPYRKSVQYTGYQINAGDSQFLVDSGSKISYNSSVTYGFRQWVKFSSVDRAPGEIINDGGFIAAKNTGSSAVTGVYNVDYATCSSNQAELVTVLNSSDEAYNAFKYTASGTDYYYVLDGTQTDWTDDLSSIGYHLQPEYEEITLYLPTYQKWTQYNATSATTTISKTNGGDTVHPLYTDTSRTILFIPDLTKIYKFGYYNSDDEWVEAHIQSIHDLPTTTTSNIYDVESALSLLNSGLMWIANNYTLTSVSGHSNVTYRAYPDDRTWTQETLYEEQTTIYHQSNCTCYTSPIPSGGPYKSRLYRDASRTNRFYYDLDKDYRRVYESNGELVIAQRQTIFDMPTTTGVAAYAIIILKTGEEWCVKSQSGSTSFQGSTIIIQSAPKHYDEPTITLDLALNGASAPAVTFGANDYWYAYLRNPLDKQKAQDFGLTFYIGSDNEAQLSNAVLNSFNIEILALCDVYENTVLTNMSNFSVGTRNNDRITINSVNAYSTATNYWRVRITKKTT